MSYPYNSTPQPFRSEIRILRLVFSDKYPPEEEKVVGLEIVEFSPVEIKFGFSESPCPLFKDEDDTELPLPKELPQAQETKTKEMGEMIGEGKKGAGNNIMWLIESCY